MNTCIMNELKRIKIIFAKQMHHIAAGDASFDIQAVLCYNNGRKAVGIWEYLKKSRLS